MDTLFVPSTRLRDLLVVQNPNEEDIALALPDEVELTTHGAEAFVNGTWTWRDLYQFFRGKDALWLGPHAFLGKDDDGGGLMEVPGFEEVGSVMVYNGRGRGELRLYLSLNDPSTSLCDILVQFLLRCEGKVSLFAALQEGRVELPPPPLPRILGQMLPQLLTEPPRFSTLFIGRFELDEGTCRLLDVDMREDVQLQLFSCTASREGGRALFDLIRRNRGPSSLANCCIDDIALADALRGNTSVKELQLWGDRDESNNPAILRALGDNVGLARLILRLEIRLSDEVWTEMCQSLGGHPNMELLHVKNTATHDESSVPGDPHPGHPGRIMSGARRTFRTQALVDMLRVNTVIETIFCTPAEVDLPLFQNQVVPRLALNQYRLRFGAVAATRGALRAPLLGRAVHTVNDNTSLMYKLLSDNLDAISNEGGL